MLAGSPMTSHWRVMSRVSAAKPQDPQPEPEPEPVSGLPATPPRWLRAGSVASTPAVTPVRSPVQQDATLLRYDEESAQRLAALPEPQFRSGAKSEEQQDEQPDARQCEAETSDRRAAGSDDVAIAACGVHDPATMGPVIRLCGSFGVSTIQHVYYDELDEATNRTFWSQPHVLKDLQLGSTTVSTHHAPAPPMDAAMPCLSQSVSAYINTLPARPPVVVLGVRTGAVSLHDFKFPQRCQILVSSDIEGVDEQILQKLRDGVDCVVSMPGTNHGMDLATTLAVALYEYRRQWPLGKEQPEGDAALGSAGLQSSRTDVDIETPPNLEQETKVAAASMEEKEKEPQPQLGPQPQPQLERVVEGAAATIEEEVEPQPQQHPESLELQPERVVESTTATKEGKEEEEEEPQLEPEPQPELECAVERQAEGSAQRTPDTHVALLHMPAPVLAGPGSSSAKGARDPSSEVLDTAGGDGSPKKQEAQGPVALDLTKTKTETGNLSSASASEGDGESGEQGGTSSKKRRGQEANELLARLCEFVEVN